MSSYFFPRAIQALFFFFLILTAGPPPRQSYSLSAFAPTTPVTPVRNNTENDWISRSFCFCLMSSDAKSILGTSESVGSDSVSALLSLTQKLRFVDTVLWLCSSQLISDTLNGSHRWCPSWCRSHCDGDSVALGRHYIISLYSAPPYPPPPPPPHTHTHFSPSLISLMVSVDVS